MKNDLSLKITVLNTGTRFASSRLYDWLHSVVPGRIIKHLCSYYPSIQLTHTLQTFLLFTSTTLFSLLFSSHSYHKTENYWMKCQHHVSKSWANSKTSLPSPHTNSHTHTLTFTRSLFLSLSLSFSLSLSLNQKINLQLLLLHSPGTCRHHQLPSKHISCKKKTFTLDLLIDMQL